MEDKYKRVTQAQLEIWLDNPVTQKYLQCLGWSKEQIQEVLGKGGYIDSDNNDKSMNRIHSALGEQAGLEKAQDPTAILIAHQMLELEAEEEHD